MEHDMSDETETPETETPETEAPPKQKVGGLVKLLDPKAADALYKGGEMTLPGGKNIGHAEPLLSQTKPPKMEAELSVTQTFQFPYKGVVYEAQVVATPSKGFSIQVVKDINGTPQPTGSGLDKAILGAVITQYAMAQGFDPTFNGLMVPQKEADPDDGPDAPDGEES
jgi:hypothetical protein